jgi:hypothetical protein
MRRTPLLAALFVSGCLGYDEPTESPPQGMPDGHKVTAPTVQHTPSRADSPIQYNGGPVMTGNQNNIYLIWYGNWNNNAQSIITDWASNIGGSPYFNINTTYYDSTNTFVQNAMGFGGQTTDNESQGNSIDDNGVQTIVSNAIGNGSLPTDPSGIYFVLGAADVMESSGMCSQYCGWHYFGNIAGQTTTYSFVGNPDQCPTSCEAQQTSPNGDAGADGAISILSHELEETVTDPQTNAWTDAQGEENGDKCAWNFGTEQAAPNGAMFNETVGARSYLIQQNWNASTQACAQSL